MIGRALLFFTVPVLLAMAAGWFMGFAADLGKYRSERTPSPAAVSPAQRYRGYTAADIDAYWAPSDENWRKAELRFLRYDLGYPLVYGVLVAWALLGARSALGLSFSEAWIYAAVAVPVVADWVENAILLRQLPADVAGRWALDPTWIAVASVATQAKWLGLVAALGFLLVLCGRLAFGR